MAFLMIFQVILKRGTSLGTPDGWELGLRLRCSQGLKRGTSLGTPDGWELGLNLKLETSPGTSDGLRLRR
jgi:hypothetical protein